jgi:CBS domain-containing protein
VDKNGNFSSLLTQHRIVSWLSNIELDWYGEFGLLTMANLEFTNKPVVTVPATYTLSDAFVVMWINKLGSIGLTKASGGLMGVLSVSDLKDLGETAQMFVSTTIWPDRVVCPIRRFYSFTHCLL